MRPNPFRGRIAAPHRAVASAGPRDGTAAPPAPRRRRLRGAGGIIAATLCLGGCGSGSPGAAPTPLLYTFSFGSDVATFRPYTMWLQDAREGVRNEIAVEAVADFEQDCPVHRLQFTISYDPFVLQAENHTEGPFMQQGDVAPQTSVTYTRGRISLRSDRPRSASGAFGRATVITVRFRAAGPYARGGLSPLEWRDAQADTANFFDCLHDARDAYVSVR